MDLSAFGGIALQRDGMVLHATLNRPETLNAFDDDLLGTLRHLVMAVREDDETRVLVLTGAGKTFSAGGDMVSIQKGIDDPRLFLDGVREGRQMIEALLDCPKPIIAKVNGAAMGLGATIALFCDIAIAAEHAQIADPHVRIGLVAGDGGAVIWPALMGLHRAKRYLLTGDAISGAEAARVGLIDSAVPADDLDREVHDLAHRIAANPPLAVQWTKLSANIGIKRIAGQVLETSFAYEALTNRTKDHQEALTAFLEKRSANFTGE